MPRRPFEEVKHPEKSHKPSPEVLKKMSERQKNLPPDSPSVQTRFGGPRDPKKQPGFTTRAGNSILRNDFWLDFFSNIISIEELGRYQDEREEILRRHCATFKRTYHDDIVPKTLGEERAYTLAFERSTDFEKEKWMVDRVEGKATFKVDAQIENNNQVFIRGFALPDDDTENITEEE